VRFAEVAGTSAGSIVASLLGAGASPDTLDALVSQSPLSELLAPPEKQVGIKRRLVHLVGRVSQKAPVGDAVAYGGAYSTEQLRNWLNDTLTHLLPESRRRIRFSDLLLPTWVVATDLDDRAIQVWSSDTTPEYEVAAAVAASCALPFFFQPVDGRYVDGGVLSNLPAFVFAQRPRRTSDRVLAFTLEADPPGPRNRQAGPFAGMRRDLEAIADTIVGGSMQLQLGLQPEVSVVKIPTGDIRATDFDKMTPAVTQKLIADGYAATDKFFKRELHSVNSGPGRRREHQSRDETWGAIASWALEPMNTLSIAAPDTKWVFDLFPALLRWRADGVRVRVLVPHPGKDGKRLQQHATLTGLGAELRYYSGNIGNLCFLRDARQSSTKFAIVGASIPGVHSVVYSTTAADGEALEALARDFSEKWDSADRLIDAGDGTFAPLLVPYAQDAVLGALRDRIEMYRNASIDFDKVPLEQLVPLARTVPLHKYRQASVWDNLYSRNGLTVAQMAAVQLQHGPSVIGPPVVEVSGDDYFIIQGTARALRARHAGAADLSCVVVRGASEPLPAAPQDFRKLNVVVDPGDVTSRFREFDYSRFRAIEDALRALHPAPSYTFQPSRGRGAAADANPAVKS
jgi:predicted acylesterase/phospholipase RssA